MTTGADKGDGAGICGTSGITVVMVTGSRNGEKLLPNSRSVLIEGGYHIVAIRNIYADPILVGCRLWGRTESDTTEVT